MPSNKNPYVGDGINSTDTPIGRTFKHLAEADPDPHLTLAFLSLAAVFRGDVPAAKPSVTKIARGNSPSIALVNAIWDVSTAAQNMAVGGGGGGGAHVDTAARNAAAANELLITNLAAGNASTADLTAARMALGTRITANTDALTQMAAGSADDAELAAQKVLLEAEITANTDALTALNAEVATDAEVEVIRAALQAVTDANKAAGEIYDSTQDAALTAHTTAPKLHLTQPFLDILNGSHVLDLVPDNAAHTVTVSYDNGKPDRVLDFEALTTDLHFDGDVTVDASKQVFTFPDNDASKPDAILDLTKFLHEDDLLSDVTVGGADATHNADVTKTTQEGVDNHASQIGVPVADTDMGAFAGTLLPDGKTTKELLQVLETDAEAQTYVTEGNVDVTAVVAAMRAGKALIITPASSPITLQNIPSAVQIGGIVRSSYKLSLGQSAQVVKLANGGTALSVSSTHSPTSSPAEQTAMPAKIAWDTFHQRYLVDVGQLETIPLSFNDNGTIIVENTGQGVLVLRDTINNKDIEIRGGESWMVSHKEGAVAAVNVHMPPNNRALQELHLNDTEPNFIPTASATRIRMVGAGKSVLFDSSVRSGVYTIYCTSESEPFMVESNNGIQDGNTGADPNTGVLINPGESWMFTIQESGLGGGGTVGGIPLLITPRSAMREEFDTEALLLASEAISYKRGSNKADGKEYVFILTADLTPPQVADTANLSDDADTGKWVIQADLNLVTDIGNALIVLDEHKVVENSWTDEQVNTYPIDTSTAEYLEITFRETGVKKRQFTSKVELGVAPYRSFESPYSIWHVNAEVTSKGVTTDIRFGDYDVNTEVVGMRAIGYAPVRSVFKASDVQIDKASLQDGDYARWDLAQQKFVRAVTPAGMTHSFTEQLTTETWFDGKPIYARSFDGAISNGGADLAVFPAGTVDTLVDVKGQVLGATGVAVGLDFSEGGYVNYWKALNGSFHMKNTWTGGGATKAQVTVFFTKP